MRGVHLMQLSASPVVEATGVRSVHFWVRKGMTGCATLGSGKRKQPALGVRQWGEDRRPQRSPLQSAPVAPCYVPFFQDPP